MSTIEKKDDFGSGNTALICFLSIIILLGSLFLLQDMLHIFTRQMNDNTETLNIFENKFPQLQAIEDKTSQQEIIHEWTKHAQNANQHYVEGFQAGCWGLFACSLGVILMNLLLFVYALRHYLKSKRQPILLPN